MEFNQMVDEKFNLLKNSIIDTAKAVRDCEDKQVIDMNSKSVVKYLFAVKQIAKEIDSKQGYGNTIHEEISNLEQQLRDQEEMMRLLEKYQKF